MVDVAVEAVADRVVSEVLAVDRVASAEAVAVALAEVVLVAASEEAPADSKVISNKNRSGKYTP